VFRALLTPFAPADEGATADAATQLARDALAERPAWLLPLLQERAASATNVTEPALAAALPRLCYQFQNGERFLPAYPSLLAELDFML